MTAIVFPDFARSIGGAMALRQNEQQNAFQMERARRQDQIEAEDREAGSHFGAALKGDPTAIAKVSANPKFALPLAQYMQKMSDGERAKLKEQFEVTGKTAAGILALPDAEQPAAYESAYANLTAQGYKINLPPKWSPALKGQLQSYAVQVPEYLKLLGDRPAPMGGAVPGAAAGGAGNAANAIAGIESGGRYDAIGPAANEKGNRAYGKYQVMDFNVGPWTQEVLGRQMSPQEFLANPQAQDAVFNAKFGQYVTKYGSPQAASRAWFAGEGGVNNPGAKDVLGTSVADYETKFANAYGPGANGPQVAQGAAPPRADASGNPLPPAGADPEVFGIKSWLAKTMPGATPMGVRGKPVYDSQGKLMIQRPDGSTDWVEVPKAKDAKGAGGPFGGTSVEAQALNMLIANGTLNPQQAAELAAGKTITNPADGSVIFMTPSGLFGQKPGQAPQPVGAPGAAPAGGTPAPATPPGMIPVTPPKPQQMTEGQANAALYADRMRASEKIIAENERAGLDPQGRLLEKVPGGNYLQSESYQLLEQARRDFINAVLRRESGAVISPEEFENATKQYFPQPGDAPAVLKQKAENRRTAIEGISRAAGPTYKPTANQPAPTQPQAAPTPPKVGEVIDGYVFRGGDPADQNNWSKSQ